MRNPYAPTHKKCRKCEEVKLISEFRPQQARCKRCHSERNRQWHARNPDAVLAIKRKYREANADRLRRKYAESALLQTENIWRAMIQRCEDDKADNYARYGGRGISVCRRWRDSCESFIADMGIRPSAQYSLDRFPDNDGNYEPGNVRWATKDQQRANQRLRTRASLSAAAIKGWQNRRAREVAA